MSPKGYQFLELLLDILEMLLELLDLSWRPLERYCRVPKIEVPREKTPYGSF